MAHDVSKEAYETRLAEVRRQLAETGDMWVITRPENIYYLTGYRAAHIAARTAQLHAVIVPAVGEPILVGRSLEAETTRDQRVERLILLDDHEDPYAAIAGAVDLRPGATIGVEERFISARQLRRLLGAYEDLRTTDITGRIEALSAHPDADEIASIRHAAAIAQAGMATGEQSLQVGRRAAHVVGEVHRAMYDAGQTDFDKALVAVWSGANGGAMHDTRVSQPLERGDVATIEIMGVHHHYRIGVQGCWILDAEPSPEIAAAHRLVVEMHDAARAAIRAGATARSVFAAADEVYRAARGIGYHRRVGGSMGLTNFAVDLTRDNDAVLTKGQPILVQTLVDDPVLLTHASTVLVTDDGCEPLTFPPRDLRLRGDV